jgi:vacuolar-type H+-ATPase subunit E/Vma4
MGSSEIIREVDRQTALELEDLLGSADRQAAALVESATAALRARVEAAVGGAEPAVRAQAGRRVNAARSRLGQRRVEHALARTTAVHEAAAARLETITKGEGARWPAALVRLTTEALDLAGQGATVRIRARDGQIIGRLVEQRDAVLELVDDAPAGVVALSADGRLEVDATVPVRLDRARVRLAETVAASLGLTG